MKYEINDIVRVIRSNYWLDPQIDVGYVGKVVCKHDGRYLIDFNEVLEFTHDDAHNYKESTYRWYLASELELVVYDEISDILEDEIAILLRN